MLRFCSYVGRFDVVPWSVDHGLSLFLPWLFVPLLWIALRRVRLVGGVVDILRAPFVIAQ